MKALLNNKIYTDGTFKETGKNKTFNRGYYERTIEYVINDGTYFSKTFSNFSNISDITEIGELKEYSDEEKENTTWREVEESLNPDCEKWFNREWGINHEENEEELENYKEEQEEFESLVNRMSKSDAFEISNMGIYAQNDDDEDYLSVKIDIESSVAIIDTKEYTYATKDTYWVEGFLLNFYKFFEYDAILDYIVEHEDKFNIEIIK